MPFPLFYTNVVPLNRETHKGWRLDALPKPLDFARTAHLVPAVIDEFASAAGQMPIAFLPGAAHPTAVFVTGLKPGTNVFVTPDGRWTVSHVPAYLRRYPFIIGEVTGGDPVLCIDDAFAGFSQTKGARLFGDTGEPEKPVTEALNLANSYRASAARTDSMCQTLQRLGLFRSVTLDAKLPDGQGSVVHGLLIVDEELLNGLADEVYLELRRAGYLKAIYAHLGSLAAVSRLAEQVAPAPAWAPRAASA